MNTIISEIDHDIEKWRGLSYRGRLERSRSVFFIEQTSFLRYADTLKEVASKMPEQTVGKTSPGISRVQMYIIESALKDSNFSVPSDKIDYNTLQNEHLNDYVNDVTKEIQESNDIVHLLVRKADCLIRKTSLLETVVTENLAGAIDEKIKNGLVDYSEDIPMITPFFTPDEKEALTNQEIDPYEYVFTDQKELHEKLRTASTEYELDSTEENAQKLIDLGWNPSVPYNEHTMKFARDRIIKWFNENKAVQIIDLSEMVFDEASSESTNSDIHPVHIVLFRHDQLLSKVIRGWTRSEYSHAGISFDNSLKHIFSFNARKEDNGFADESVDQYKGEIKSGGHLEVVTFFVSSKVKAQLQRVIKFFIDNKSKTKYAFENILRYVTKHAIDTSKSMNMVCSQFVDFALKSCNLDLTGKPSNLVFPGDFEKPPMDSRMYITFKGEIEKFKPQSIANRVRFLLKKPHDELITRSALGENGAIDRFLSSKRPEYLFNNNSSSFFYHENAEEVMKEIRECLTPQAIITEAKPSPLRFGKKGDLYIDLPRNLEREYQDAHTLLTSYSNTNTTGIKHELARLFYLNSILDKRIQKMKVGDKQYKQCIDLRARVKNDFTRYFKIVDSQEKNFDFEAYYKSTEYYPKTIKVSGDTLKYSGKLIKDFIKSQGI